MPMVTEFPSSNFKLMCIATVRIDESQWRADRRISGRIFCHGEGVCLFRENGRIVLRNNINVAGNEITFGSVNVFHGDSDLTSGRTGVVTGIDETNQFDRSDVVCDRGSTGERDLSPGVQSCDRQWQCS